MSRSDRAIPSELLQVSDLCSTFLHREVIFFSSRRRHTRFQGDWSSDVCFSDLVLALPQAQMAGTVAAYHSLPSEPDTHGLIYGMWKRGSYVLLPLLRADDDLDWASYEGPESMREGPRGLTEPSEPPRGLDAIARADLVLVPALAVDRRGYRLGRGGGSFDRALARVGPLVPTVALLFDGELLDEIPA